MHFLVFVVSLMLWLPAAQASETPSEFGGFVRSRSVEPRTVPVDQFEWDRRTRNANSFGPAPLLPTDAALIDSAHRGRWTEALEMLKVGQARADARDALGVSVLGLAVEAGQDELVRELLRRGADPNRAGGNGFTPLGAASFRGHRSTVRLLVKAGADLNARGATGQTPLHLAAMAGRVGVIDELLRAGVNPRVVNRAGDNALDVAANSGQQDAMSRLIEAGVDPQMSGR